MGCGGSSEKGIRSVNHNQTTKYDRRPKISVRIGPEVRKLDTSPRIIFIFGGPGSRKGRIVDDLVTSYGFKHICMEEIINTDLPRKVSDVVKVETSREIRELLENDPNHVSVEWVLQMTEKRIEQCSDPSATFLIDFIPNLKYMLRLEPFLKDCSDDMERFEEKYPISFALNLAIPADKVLKTKQVYCATPPTSDGGMKETGGQGDEADTGRIQTTIGRDEVDSQCLERRAALYEQVAKWFISYFRNSDRLVTVDVACGVADFIWQKVNQVFCDLDFHPLRTVNTVILFSFKEQDCEDIDCEKYLMHRFCLAAIVDNPSDSVENLMSSLSRYIDNHSEKTESFVVDVANTSLTQDTLIKTRHKHLLFTDIQEDYLESFLPGSPKTYMPSAKSNKFKAVSSLENEICLFHPSTPDGPCSDIAYLMCRTRQL